MDSLKPCPFCGGEARTFQTATYCWSVECSTPFCGCEFATYGTEAEAIAAWNTRTAMGGECGNCGTRYHELFGTPERAARTLAGIACDDGVCEGCTLYGADCSYDSDALLEWLRGDA